MYDMIRTFDFVMDKIKMCKDKYPSLYSAVEVELDKKNKVRNSWVSLSDEAKKEYIEFIDNELEIKELPPQLTRVNVTTSNGGIHVGFLDVDEWYSEVGGEGDIVKEKARVIAWEYEKVSNTSKLISIVERRKNLIDNILKLNTSTDIETLSMYSEKELKELLKELSSIKVEPIIKPIASPLVKSIMKQFFKGRVVINCQSAREIKTLFKLCYEIDKDFKFCSGNKITALNCGYREYGKELCYKYVNLEIDEKFSPIQVNGLQYGGIDYFYSNSKLPVIKVSDMDIENYKIIELTCKLNKDDIPYAYGELKYKDTRVLSSVYTHINKVMTDDLKVNSSTCSVDIKIRKHNDSDINRASASLKLFTSIDTLEETLSKTHIIKDSKYDCIYEIKINLE